MSTKDSNNGRPMANDGYQPLGKGYQPMAVTPTNTAQNGHQPTTGQGGSGPPASPPTQGGSGKK